MYFSELLEFFLTPSLSALSTQRNLIRFFTFTGVAAPAPIFRPLVTFDAFLHIVLPLPLFLILAAPVYAADTEASSPII